MSEFEASYPLAKERIKTTYPDLTESERNIVILTFLGFRTKEEAEILHLSLNTVEKYRTNIRKKAGSDAISQLIG
jgi:DNA-binding CsgD family transcriptional regulator